MQSMSNQWLQILWPIDYSSITHWSSAIITSDTRIALPVRSPSPRKRLYLKFPISIDDGDGSENVTFKMNLRFLNIVAFIAIRWKCQMQVNFPGVDFLGTPLSLERERTIRRRLFTSSIKCKITHFYVVIVQGRQRNVQKGVPLFWRSRCLRCLLPTRPVTAIKASLFSKTWIRYLSNYFAIITSRLLCQM